MRVSTGVVVGVEIDMSPLAEDTLVTVPVHELLAIASTFVPLA